MSSTAIFRASVPWRSARRRNSSRSHIAFAPACARGIPMTNSAMALPAPRRRALRGHPLLVRIAPVTTVVLALVAIWYVAAVLMNMALVRDAFEREETPYTVSELIVGTMEAERPLLPAPHQVIAAFLDAVFGYPPGAPRSLVFHSAVTLSATLLGFALGALLGI